MGEFKLMKANSFSLGQSKVLKSFSFLSLHISLFLFPFLLILFLFFISIPSISPPSHLTIISFLFLHCSYLFFLHQFICFNSSISSHPLCSSVPPSIIGVSLLLPPPSSCLHTFLIPAHLPTVTHFKIHTSK